MYLFSYHILSYPFRVYVRILLRRLFVLFFLFFVFHSGFLKNLQFTPKTMMSCCSSARRRSSCLNINRVRNIMIVSKTIIVPIVHQNNDFFVFLSGRELVYGLYSVIPSKSIGSEKNIGKIHMYIMYTCITATYTTYIGNVDQAKHVFFFLEAITIAVNTYYTSIR